MDRSKIKVRLKHTNELLKYLKYTVVKDLVKLQGASEDGTIDVRCTSNEEVFVEITTGWSIPEACIDFFIQVPSDDSKDPVEVISAPNTKYEITIGDTTLYQSVSSEDLIQGLDTLDSRSAAPEGLLAIDPSLSIPENTLATVEAPEPFKMTKTLFHKMTHLTRRTHYVKLQLKEPDLSFRFFFEAEDNKYLEGSWWFVQHGRDKQSIKVDKDFIEKHFDDIIEAYEITGRLLPKKGYLKIKKNLKSGEIIELNE